MYTLAALIIGIVLDYLLGDPVYFWHPVRIMGNLIAFLEKGIRKFFQKTKKAELLGGGILVVIFIWCLFLTLVSRDLCRGMFLLPAFSSKEFENRKYKSLYSFKRTRAYSWAKSSIDDCGKGHR